ncbi:MAG: hypothetical protein HQK81_06295 [Desulfovibrionaceae bacterium]|nr:hypothetical protein [Desulfovibrionaceae bacterium]MBF0513660.1 hypothetical protein [Desulfovibrionaceae bacterium]
MKIGTKSLLIGAHQVVLHPWYVAKAWRKLYGFPRDPRLWVAFVVHDWGYWGKSDMDGPEGETHVELGARIMARLFGPAWGDFCRYHSRFRAQADGKPFSRLCLADKLSVALMPRRVYLTLARASGEIREYMARCSAEEKYAVQGMDASSEEAWFADLCEFLVAWVQAAIGQEGGSHGE